MRFNVGPWRYKVRICENPIICDGRECLGLCRETEREILIASDCPPTERLPVLLHELTHGWVFACGEPRTLEAWADLNGTMLASALRDLWTQGGEAALLRLNAGESPEWKAACLALSRNRSCKDCRGTVAGASVLCVPAGIDGILELALHCDFCQQVQIWREAAGANGLPSGTVVGEPRMLKGAAAAAFVREHEGELAAV
jgi:hypothetical protein